MWRESATLFVYLIPITTSLQGSFNTYRWLVAMQNFSFQMQFLFKLSMQSFRNWELICQGLIQNLLTLVWCIYKLLGINQVIIKVIQYNNIQWQCQSVIVDVLVDLYSNFVYCIVYYICKRIILQWYYIMLLVSPFYGNKASSSSSSSYSNSWTMYNSLILKSFTWQYNW